MTTVDPPDRRAAPTPGPDCVRRTSWRRRLCADRSCPPDLLEALWVEPDALVARGTMLKDGDRSTVVRIPHPDGDCTLKRYTLQDPLHTTVHACMRSRARWNWVSGRRLRAAGLATPMPLACVEDGFGPLRGRSFLLAAFIPGVPLDDVLGALEPDDPRLARIASSFGVAWAGLGRLRLGHDDMKGNNFIVDGDDRVWMIDLDGMRRAPLDVLYRRQRALDHDRFLANWRGLPDAVGAAFRAAMAASG